MWSGRLATAAARSSPAASTAASSWASHRSSNWTEALAALAAASDNVAAHRAALQTVHEQPREIAARVVQHCLTMQRYSDACTAAAFPLLCDALAVVPEAGTPDEAAAVIRLSMQRGAYVDSAGFGPLLRLYNLRLGAKAYPEVTRLWTWVQHTRASHCSIARSAVVAATARDGQHGAAMRLEAALRVDGVLLREEGLVPLIESLPVGEWQVAVSLVRHWTDEHKAAAGALAKQRLLLAKASNNGAGADAAGTEHADASSHDNPPSLATAMSLVRACAAAGKGAVARTALAHWLEDPDVLMAMSIADLKDALDAVLPACSPTQAPAAAAATTSSSTGEVSGSNTDASSSSSSNTSSMTASSDLLRRLLLASSVAVAGVDRPFSRFPENTQQTVAALLGHMAAAAALLRSREDLMAIGDHITRLGFGSTLFDTVMNALVAPLRPVAWREGKLAAAELSRRTKLEVPLVVQARLHVLHQAVAGDDEAVLDAAIGR